MSKIENGLMTLTSDELENIARALDYPVSFFQRNERVHGVGLSEFYHRKRQSVPQKALNMIYAKLETRRMEIASLLKSIDLDELNFPYMDPDKFNGDITKIAQLVRASWLVSQGPIEFVIELIEEAGGIVISFNFEDANIDAITVFHPNTPPLIFTNLKRPVDRIRFTLAHELGHIIMHRTPPSEETDIEEQADLFASEFLMPKSEISPSLNNLTIQRLASLKLYWKVSMAALLVRASSLGKVSEGQSNYLWGQLSKAGYRTKEPDELEPAKETPQLLNDIIKLHQVELNYSTTDLSQVLNLNDSEFRSLYTLHNSHLRRIK